MSDQETAQHEASQAFREALIKKLRADRAITLERLMGHGGEPEPQPEDEPKGAQEPDDAA